MRLGLRPKGVMGSGVVVSDPEEGPHWDPNRAAQGDTGLYVKILFDVLNDTPLLGEEILSSGLLHNRNWYPQASGTYIPEGVANHLESLWSSVTGTTFASFRIDEHTAIHLEGTRRTRLINACERNPKARAKCIEHYGAKCQVCNLNFEDRYSEIGKGFIHVHHVVQMAEIGEEYEVNPVADLRPVCPNCHAMLHKRTPPYSIHELVEIMNTSNLYMASGCQGKKLSCRSESKK
jgi:5-methylcytosine-specific restriction protein A